MSVFGLLVCMQQVEVFAIHKFSRLFQAQIPLIHLARLDTFDFVEPVETSVLSETSRAVPTWRTTNKLVQV